MHHHHIVATEPGLIILQIRDNLVSIQDSLYIIVPQTLLLTKFYYRRQQQLKDHTGIILCSVKIISLLANFV